MSAKPGQLQCLQMDFAIDADLRDPRASADSQLHTGKTSVGTNLSILLGSKFLALPMETQECEFYP